MATPSRELAAPLQIDSTGGFKYYTDPADMAAAHVRMIVATELGERVMLAGYGTPTVDYLFDSITDELLDDMKQQIADALAEWGDDVTVQSLDVTAVDSTVSVNIGYALNNSPDTNLQTTSVTLQV